jgi:PilZ domain-containing protein
MISQSEIEALLQSLARDQRVNVCVGDPERRTWFRAQVVSHDAASGRLVLTCYMDRPSDRPLEPGERVLVAAERMDNELQSAPMDVEQCGEGPNARVQLRIAGLWRAEDERRHQARVRVRIVPARARRWVGGAWHDIDATVIDVGSRGVGLSLDQTVKIGDRLSLVIPLADGQPDLRVTVELRHAREEASASGRWRAGGLFRNLPPADHERVIRFIFAELRTRQRL